MTERGSAPAEFVLVTVLLLAMTFGVLQLGAVLYVRNTAQDAAAEGARWAALAGNTLDDGTARTRLVLATTFGAGAVRSVSARMVEFQGAAATEVQVETPFPVIGFLGPAGTFAVTGHAALEVAP